MTSDQLTRITLRANQRIDELFEEPTQRTIPRLTPGMVRIVLDVAGEVPPVQVAAPVIDAASTPLDALGADEEGADILAPLNPAGLDAQALDRVAAKVKAALERKGKRPAQLPQAENAPQPRKRRSKLSVDELRSLALDDIRRIAGSEGTWVSGQEFNAQRDARLPVYTSIAKRLGLSWIDVVREALGERAQPPDLSAQAAHARQAKAEQAEQEADAQPAPNFRKRVDERAPRAQAAVESTRTPHTPDQRRALLRDILAELAMMADGNVMPDPDTWDSRKPERLPASRAILLAWDVSWDELAKWANLEPAPKRRKVHANSSNGAAKSVEVA